MTRSRNTTGIKLAVRKKTPTNGKATPVQPVSRVAASLPEASRRMKAVRLEGTEPELHLRSALHRRGLRFRVQVQVLQDFRRSVDIWFPTEKVAVFCDGCFWHGCPRHGTQARANQAFWQAKVAANRARDLDTNQRLAEAGCTVIRIWEHEEPEAAAERIARVVRKRRKRKT